MAVYKHIFLLLFLISFASANFGNFGWRRTKPKEKHGAFCHRAHQKDMIKVQKGAIVPIKTKLAFFDPHTKYRIYK